MSNNLPDKFAVFDEDNSAVSKALVQYLETDNEKVAIADSKESIQDELYNRNVYSVLRIPKGFGDSLKDGEIKKINPYSKDGVAYPYFYKITIKGRPFYNYL